MRTKILASFLFLAALVSSASAGTFYTTEGSFTLQLNPVFYLEDFSNFTFGSPLNGSQTTWAAPGANGYGWTASTPMGLYSNVSALSTNIANETITLTFSGLTVTAFGGTSRIRISAETLSRERLPSPPATAAWKCSTFRALPAASLATPAPFQFSMTMVATSGATNNWIQVDHFYTGAAVPEPGTMALLTLGVVGAVGAAIKRRRSC